MISQEHGYPDWAHPPRLNDRISFAACSHQAPEALGKIMNCLVSKRLSMPSLPTFLPFLGLLSLPRRHKLPSEFHYCAVTFQTLLQNPFSHDSFLRLT